MKTAPPIIVLFAMCGFGTAVGTAGELSGHVAVEARTFFNEATLPEQRNNNSSIALQPEYYHAWEDGSSFTFTPFVRIDSADSERTHFDIRELNYLWLQDTWQLRIGVSKVFWGVTEFVHLVDIINQTDLVEHIDFEEKLGQPMVQLSLPRDWGVVDAFVLPYFRERTFPGKKGRLRPTIPIDTDHAEYESAAEEHNVDFALRYSHTIGDWDFGIYHFAGTSREPTLLTRLDKSGLPVLIPYYEQINQTGLDLQLVTGQWLWKLEALHRTGQGDSFFAGTGGFEYTEVGVADTAADLGIIGEWAYDERGDEATTAFQNDVIFGLRVALNDLASSQLLAGFIQDTESSARAVRVEASRRIGSAWKLSLAAWAFFDAPEDDILYYLRKDDFLRLELSYYF